MVQSISSLRTCDLNRRVFLTESVFGGLLINFVEILAMTWLQDEGLKERFKHGICKRLEVSKIKKYFHGGAQRFGASGRGEGTI